MKAFETLIKNKQIILLEDLTEDEKEIMKNKTVNHYIVWRVVFKPSLSTPARPVFDGSARTRPRPDGSGGRCLNDLVVKGRIVSLNLTKMILRFSIGSFAVQGDLRQFYASIKLQKDQWNLQRVLLKEDLDPNSKEIEAVIVTLIWGIKCVSAQTEAAVTKLAEEIEEENPRLAEFLKEARFVDDLRDSDTNLEALKNLTRDADNLFQKVGLSCKGWSFNGEPPPEEVSEEYGTVSIGGMKWYTVMDCLEVPIPPLHFSKKSRGRLEVGSGVFAGKTMEEIDDFVPKNLTRKMILSKKASLFDILGKLTPISAGLSLDLRKAMKETTGWDDPVSPSLQNNWQ